MGSNTRNKQGDTSIQNQPRYSQTEGGASVRTWQPGKRQSSPLLSVGWLNTVRMEVVEVAVDPETPCTPCQGNQYQS